MATTENAEVSTDHKINRCDPNAKYPLKVLYCGGTAHKQETGGGGGSAGEVTLAGEEEEKKKQKRGGRGQIKQKKKTVPQKATIAKIPRAKKKYVTRVCGLATFDIDLKEAQRFFAQKFSCGVSVTAEDEIIIQGDFTDDIIEVIQEKWPEVDDDSIDDLGEVKK
ncbi:Density-regulated protein [Triplophysa tibetana]|uniref:Density-regulated protein n=1 Tax=Triplophysa tibetana TaxID=1572043 RepID=A0A5A9N3I7_9TELE|nr:Density-regulated protein [Triplophysa tibetana]